MLLKKALTIGGKLIKREINYYRIQPSNLLLFLTYRCTSRCNSCVMWQRKPTQPELTLEQWKNLIDMASDYKIKNIEMFGGDALLRKDALIALTKYAKRKGIPEIELATNCILMDEDTASALVDSGMGVIYISVDGLEDSYSRVRGVDVFEKVKRGIEYLVKARNGKGLPKIFVNCTISSLNVNGFERVLAFAEGCGADAAAFEYAGEFPREALSKSKISGIEPQPYYIPQKSSILLDSQQARLLKNKLKTLRRDSAGRKIKLLTRNIDVLKTEHLVSGKFPNKKCYVCRYIITVDPYGNIIPCPFFCDYHLGNVKTGKLREIWKNKKHYKFIRSIDREEAELCKYCILGVERNPTPFQELMQSYLAYKNVGLDE